MEQKKEVKSQDALLGSLIKSNKLLSDANSELVLRLEQKNSELEKIQSQLNDIINNSVSKEQFRLIREQITRKNNTLTKLNDEIEHLRKNNISNDALVQILGKLKIELKNTKIENSLKDKDIERLKIFLDEKNEAMKTLLHETKKATSYAEKAQDILKAVQSQSHQKDDLIVKIDNEVTEYKKNTIKFKQRLADEKKKTAVLKEHIKIVEEDNQSLSNKAQELLETKQRLMEIAKENKQLKDKLKDRELHIDKLSENFESEKKNILSNNVQLLESLRQEFDKINKESDNHQKLLINLISKTKNSLN